MLQNWIYRGETVHRDKSYPGEHEAIIDEDLWTEVQSILMGNRADRIFGTTEKHVSLLTGILFDARDERTTPTHATKNGTRYRYYISRSLLTGAAKDSGQRIPAANLEALVIRRIHGWLADRAAMLDIVQGQASDAAAQKGLMVALERRVASWPELGANDIRNFVVSIVSRIQVHADRIDILLNPIRLVRWLGQTDGRGEPECIHKTLRTTPAMAANVTKRLWEIGDIVDVLESWEAAN